MGLITLTYVFSVGNTIIASQHNTNNSVIYNDYNGNIQDVNIAAGAGIEYTKLSLTGTIKQSDMLSTFNNNSGFGFIPSGGIIMWSGTIASIPTGWYLCNGSNGTPDLRNKFIVCANADSGGVAKTTISGSATQSGGSTTILQANLPAVHLNIFDTGVGHSGQIYGDTAGGGSNPSWKGDSDNSTAQGPAYADLGGSGTVFLQPYYAIAYIMKS